MRLRPLFLFAFLTACADFPALEGTISPGATRAAYPALVPLDPILAQAEALDQSALTPAVAGQVLDRAQALRARAARLRGPVIDPATRARMRRGIDTSALQ